MSEKPFHINETNLEYADLYALMGAPFERDFEASDYKATLELEVNEFANTFKQKGLSKYLHSYIDAELETDRRWVADIGYVAHRNSLGFTKLELPLKVDCSNYSLVFKRLETKLGNNKNRRFLPFISVEGQDDILISNEIDETGNVHTRTINEDTIDSIIYLAGYRLPKIFNTPNDLRLSIAQITDNTKNWSMSEYVGVPVSANFEINLNRLSESKFDGERQNMLSELSACFIRSNDKFGDKKRRQIEVCFRALDYFVEDPVITSSELVRTSNEIVTDPSTNSYAKTNINIVNHTQHTIDEISNYLLESLLGKLG